MRNRGFLVVLLFSLLISSSLIAQTNGIEVVSSAVYEKNEPVIIKIEVDDPDNFSELSLYYKSVDNVSLPYLSKAFTKSEDSFNQYEVTVPYEPSLESGIAYYIEATLSSGDVVTLPEDVPEDNPLIASFTKASTKRETGKIVIISPEKNEKLKPDELVIAFSFLLGSEDLDLYSMEILLDGDDVAHRATITPYLVSYEHVGTLAPGFHKIRILIDRKDGSGQLEKSWSFSIEGKVVKYSDFKANGEIIYKNDFEDNDGDSEFDNSVEMKVRGSMSRFSYNTRVFLTSKEADDVQPQNRYTLKMGIPELRFNIGDFNPKYSKLTLIGQRVRGGQMHLQLGFFGLDMIYGHNQRGVDGSYTLEIDSLVVPANVDTVYNYSYVYDREIIALRPTFGTGKNVKYGLTFIRMKDDVESIDYGKKPKENLIVGTDLTLNFFNKRVSFKTEIATTILTNDIAGGALTKEDLETLLEDDAPDIDPSDYEDYFTINLSTVPLPKDASALKSNTSFYTGLRLFAYNNLMNIEFMQTGPSFNNLANSSVRKDKKTLQLSDNLRVLDNRMALSGMLKLTDDNISGAKKATLSEVLYSLSVAYSPQGLPSVYLGFKNQASDNGDIFADTMNTVIDSSYSIDNQNSALTFNTSYNFEYYGDNRVTLGFTNGANTYKYNEVADNNYNVISLSLKNKFSKVLGFNAGFSYYTSEQENDNRETNTLNVSFRTNYKYDIFNNYFSFNTSNTEYTTPDFTVNTPNRTTSETKTVNKLTLGSNAKYQAFKGGMELFFSNTSYMDESTSNYGFNMMLSYNFGL